MLKLLFWVVKWLAKSTRTLDLFGCKKMVVDEETSAKSIYWGQNVICAVAVAIILLSTYLIIKGHDIFGIGLLILGYLGFIALWKTGDKITITIDEALKLINKTLKSEPTGVINTYMFTYADDDVFFDVQYNDPETDYTVTDILYDGTITLNPYDSIIEGDEYTNQLFVGYDAFQELINTTPSFKEQYDKQFGFICDYFDSEYEIDSEGEYDIYIIKKYDTLTISTDLYYDFNIKYSKLTGYDDWIQTDKPTTDIYYTIEQEPIKLTNFNYDAIKKWINVEGD